MTSEEAAALAERLAGIIGLLDAITSYLGPRDQVNLACAAVAGSHLDPAAVAEFTRLLGGPPAPAFTPACLSCGATADLDAVHRAATMGVAARVEHYCHNHTECGKRRHLFATSAGAA